MRWDPSLCNPSAHPGAPTQEPLIQEPPLLQGQAWPLTSVPAPQSRPQELGCCEDTPVLGPFPREGRCLPTCSSFWALPQSLSSVQQGGGPGGAQPNASMPTPSSLLQWGPSPGCHRGSTVLSLSKQGPDGLPASQLTVPCGPLLARAAGTRKVALLPHSNAVTLVEVSTALG